LERLEQALAELGALTPDGIADHMRALGIKGFRSDSCRCALAVHLAKLGVEGATVTLTFDPVVWHAVLPHGAYVQLPPAAVEFAERFDDGVYLDMVVVDGGAADA
jgi:hypothetical protein